MSHYVMFPQHAKEFLQWRPKAAAPERELVAQSSCDGHRREESQAAR